MGLLDKFLDAIKLNDDYDDDDDFLDDDFEDDDYEEAKPKRRFFKKADDDDDLDALDDIKPAKTAVKEKEPKVTIRQRTAAASTAAKAAPKARAKANNKITPMRKKGAPTMEVNVIRPASMEDTREIADTLLDSCTVVLNLEGLDVDIAQRIIDFTCGACYALNGSLQKISSYIFILTPVSVDISGDFQEILSGAFELPSMRTDY